MIEKLFIEVYDKFRLSFYGSVFENDHLSNLTLAEAICLEVIKILGRPTISQLTEFMNISQPNMTYRLSGLIEKGYVKKVQSTQDKREYYLELTENFWEYDEKNKKFFHKIADKIKKQYTEEQLSESLKILESTSKELTYELDRYWK